MKDGRNVPFADLHCLSSPRGAQKAMAQGLGTTSKGRTVSVRAVESATAIYITIPTVGRKTSSRTFQRQPSELLSKSLEKISASLGGGKTRLLDRDGLEIAGGACGASWAGAAVLEVGGERFAITVNPPAVVKGTLRFADAEKQVGLLLVDCAVRPEIELEFAEGCR
jgi:hypothetical protein